MTIKGKGKTRRRAVAAGPKPVYVEPPKPPWRRRWVQLTALAVLLAGIAVAVVVTIVHLGNVHRKEQAAARKEKEAAIVSQFGSQVDQGMQAVSQRFQDALTPFPELTSSVSSVKPDTPFPSHDVAVFRASVKLAKGAAGTVQKIDTASLISGHPKLLPLIDAQNDIVQAVNIYQQAATALLAADKASGSARTALIGQGKNLVKIGSQLFSQGYQKLTNLRVTFGITLPNQLPPPPQPAVSATPTASAPPSAKASASPTKKSKKKKS